MHLFRGKGLYLAGLMFLFPQAGMADGGRTDLSGPGEAEVVAGTGYQHTLFDSADDKCQHCHNDLYDTWKTSMHAQSWADPIFQSKYQDFLRLQVSKIGATGPTGEYREGTIQKTAQVCIKCHAPAAYYSGDYSVQVTQVGDVTVDPAAYTDGLALEDNLAPAYDPAVPAIVASMSTQGKVYTVSYHIGHSHNREGINCAFCHSIETVRMMNDQDGDGGRYTLETPLKQGPIGPIVRAAGDTLWYSPSAHDPDMNAFFALIGPEKYLDVGNTPKDMADFDDRKAADGRFTMKSTPTGVDADSGKSYYTGGPFYGPFGVTALSNSREDDASDRAGLVNQHFVHAVEAADGDKFTSEHHFAAYGKSLCLSCHQRSSLMLNPESNGEPGLQVGDDQFLELCSTWSAMSDGVGDNYQDSKTSPKCQRCHMEPLANKTVLHKWDNPDELFTAEDGVTEHFDPESGVGPVAEGYLNNHAFMGANTKDFGLAKIKSGFAAAMKVKANQRKLTVDTKLQNRTAHMFPGAHPMRRVLTRIVVTDAAGNRVPFESAIGQSSFRTVTNQLAVLDGDSIVPGFEKVRVEYDDDRTIVIQGQTPHLDEDGETVLSQAMDTASVDWVSPDETVGNCALEDGTVVPKGPASDDGVTWSIKGCTTVKQIIDTDETGHFTRIYGRETGKRMADGTLVVRPGFDSNVAADNRLEPNEREAYKVRYDTRHVTAWPLTVTYKVYYLKKGGSGKFPTGADGFLDTSLPAAMLKKLAIFEVYSQTETVAVGN
jgi:hypothetical protein